MVVGIAWYTEADWLRLKALPDAGDLDDSYAEWLETAKDSVQDFQRRGVIAEPIMINLTDFLRWCTIRGRSRGAKARAEYVTDKMRGWVFGGG